MDKKLKYLKIGSAVILAIIIIYIVIPGKNIYPVIHDNIDRLPALRPDYSNTVIPPNIAPLNFLVEEQGRNFFVKIYSENGNPIEIGNSSQEIIIPIDSWNDLLASNKGGKLFYDIFTQTEDGKWNKYVTVENKIAEEEIDSHLAYRLIIPAHNIWNKMGIYQRNLENFDESPILINKMTDDNCMNCHNFCMNDPDKMVMHLRAGAASGTLLINGDKVTKVNTSTDFNSAGAYPSWHPEGKLVAFSVNKLTMFFHSTGISRDVLDLASDLIIYKIESNMVTTSPKISNPEVMETFPAWSPDGKYLYFSSTPALETYFFEVNGTKDLDYKNIKYDLMRISYDAATGEWGELETVLSAKETGFSVIEARVSPGGRYLLFTGAAYGSFPIYMNDSEVYILDLQTREYKRLESNSEGSDSFHSWSSNGRWFVFASKRIDCVCGRPYFSYFDKDGKTYKPFIMPQEDPAFYDTYLMNYNVPELIKGPVKFTAAQLAAAAFDKENMLNAVLDPNVKPRGKVGSDVEYER